MPKRLTRISSDTISSRWSEISGKKANIVFDDGSVLLATLCNLRDGLIEIQDTRLQKQC